MISSISWLYKIKLTGSSPFKMALPAHLAVISSAACLSSILEECEKFVFPYIARERQENEVGILALSVTCSTRLQDDEPPYQDVLEAKYLRDPNTSCRFEVGAFHYELNMERMLQRNTTSNTVRQVKRRPLMFAAGDMGINHPQTRHELIVLL